MVWLVKGVSAFGTLKPLTEVTIEEDGWQKVPTKQAKRVAMLSFFTAYRTLLPVGSP